MNGSVRLKNSRAQWQAFLHVGVQGKSVQQILEFGENKVKRKCLLFYFYLLDAGCSININYSNPHQGQLTADQENTAETEDVELWDMCTECNVCRV